MKEEMMAANNERKYDYGYPVREKEKWRRQKKNIIDRG